MAEIRTISVSRHELEEPRQDEPEAASAPATGPSQRAATADRQQRGSCRLGCIARTTIASTSCIEEDPKGQPSIDGVELALVESSLTTIIVLEKADATAR